MQNFIKLGEVDVLPLLLQIEKNPQLWNQDKDRTTHEGSPHTGLSDIWLNYRKKEELVTKENYNEPFFPCEFYPAYYQLSEVKPILQSIMARIGCLALGGTLITKIPSGAAVKPHNDIVSWHARTYNLKAYVTIKSNPNVINWCAGESVNFKQGEVWTFDNCKEHAVYNEGADDRITLMSSMRTGM